MNLETAVALAFMIFGLGFFIFVVDHATKSMSKQTDNDHERMMNEAREFGYEDSRLQARALKLKPKKKPK